MDIGVADHRTELVERDLAVLVLVGEQNGLVDDLLQLRVLQIIADHHLQNGEQLGVRDEPVVIHIVNSERNCFLCWFLEEEEN